MESVKTCKSVLRQKKITKDKTKFILHQVMQDVKRCKKQSVNEF